MSLNSSIEWTDATWNPTTGCTKVSPGCAHCYAERDALHLHRMGQRNYRNGFAVATHPHMLERPLGWARPLRVFVNSMSDLFHEEVPFDFIRQAFEVMAKAERHTFQVLTKRSARLAELSTRLPWTPNIWAGVSIETDKYTYRADDLRRAGARVKFLSLEPLLGPLQALDLCGINWVILGGESGTGARPMDPAWVRDVRGQCVRAGVPFFFKQWGGVNRKRAGREIDGRTWDEMPAGPAPSLHYDRCNARSAMRRDLIAGPAPHRRSQ